MSTDIGDVTTHRAECEPVQGHDVALPLYKEGVKQMRQTDSGWKDHDTGGRITGIFVWIPSHNPFVASKEPI
eukprot:1182960-Ditylum_brightwellii.AAC.1